MGTIKFCSAAQVHIKCSNIIVVYCLICKDDPCIAGKLLHDYFLCQHGGLFPKLTDLQGIGGNYRDYGRSHKIGKEE